MLRSCSFAHETVARRYPRPRRDDTHAAMPQFSLHIRALWRGVSFAVAAIVLIAPMAIAARHAEAELTLTRAWPLDLSAARVGGGATFPMSSASD